MQLRQAILVVRTIITVYLSVTLVSNSILLIGIVSKWTVLFFPHFLVTPFMILLAISGGIYCIIAPGQSGLIMHGVAFGAMESLFLYATVSHYKQLKTPEDDLNISGNKEGAIVC